MFNLKGRVAVITGASSGLGKQMSHGLADQGADLVILARRFDRLIELKEELEKKGTKVLAIKCDVTNTMQLKPLSSGILWTRNRSFSRRCKKMMLR